MTRSNTGFYMGMSRRAWEAREAGKLMDHEFVAKYDITAESLDFLSRMGVIDGREWHHVEGGCCLLEEHFYMWNDEAYINAYESHKSEIDALAVKFSKIAEVKAPKAFVGHLFSYMHDQINRRGNKSRREEEDVYFACLKGRAEDEAIEAMKAAFPQYMEGYQKAAEATAKYNERKAKADTKRMELKSLAIAFFN